MLHFVFRVNIIKYAALDLSQSAERHGAKCLDFATKDEGSFDRSREKLLLRVGSLRPDENKVGEQYRAKCSEGKATDRDSNQPYPPCGKDIFPGTVTSSSGVNAVRSSRNQAHPWKELRKTFASKIGWCASDIPAIDELVSPLYHAISGLLPFGRDQSLCGFPNC
jgi:hypothetical protein